MREMDSRYAGKCAACATRFPAGERIKWDAQAKRAYHVACAPATPHAPTQAAPTQAQAAAPASAATPATRAGVRPGFKPVTDTRGARPATFETSYDSMYDLIDALIDYDEETNGTGASPIGHISRDTGPSAVAFTDCETFADALDIARHGFTAIRPTVDAILSKITEEVVTREVPRIKHRNTVAGGAVNVGRVMTGAPKCFTTYKRQLEPGVSRVLKVRVSVSNIANVPNEMIRMRGAAIVALLDALTRAGYSCEVWAVCASTACGYSGAVISTQVKIQDASDPLDIDSLMFMLSHPAMFRRLIFADREMHGSTLRGYGMHSAGDSSSVNPPPDPTAHLTIKGIDGERISEYARTPEEWALQVEHWLTEALAETQAPVK